MRSLPEEPISRKTRAEAIDTKTGRRDAVVIRRFQKGISLHLDEKMDFEELETATAEKFRRAAPFFQDACVAVSFEGRSLTPEEEKRLVNVISENSSLEVTCVLERQEEDGAVYARAVESAFRHFAQRDNTGRFYRGTLKRGQILEASESVVVMGDVKPGACVISAGNVVILGALRGTAICGGDGRAGSFVAALEMTPQKLKTGISNILQRIRRRKPFPGPSFPESGTAVKRTAAAGRRRMEYTRRWPMWNRTA